jgi:uncharacterized SAM-binding protein YcdF (DUF218 family)
VVPSVFKELFVPGGLAFFLGALTVGAALLQRKKDQGRAGRRLIAMLLVLYWIWSTPVLALPLIRLLTPAYPPVDSAAQAPGVTAIVVLGAGMEVFRSRGDFVEVSTRDDALRIMEAARVYRLLDRPWVIVTGGLGTTRHSEAARMAEELGDLGVPSERIVIEPRAENTHEHAIYVPPLLTERHITRFVLVTSRQHIARALAVFRRAGWDPIPSSPEPYADNVKRVEWFIPSKNALFASQMAIYDKLGWIYYRLRGWV